MTNLPISDGKSRYHYLRSVPRSWLRWRRILFERDSANGGDFGERRDRTGAYFASNATSCRASYLAGRARSTAGIAAGIVSAGMFVGIAAGVAAHVAAAVAASGGETARAMAARASC